MTVRAQFRVLRIAGSTVAIVAAGLLIGSVAAPASAASTACPWVGSSAPISQRVSALMARMTTAQKVSVLIGTGGSNYVGFIPAIGSLCIPAINLEDGPAGVGDGMTNVTQLPAPVDVAATWDTSAEQLYGQVIGGEQAAKGTTTDLGPTINIVRDPRWGRAFETIGEDSYLNGHLGAAYIRGIQSTGVMAQVKHLAVYNQETNRNTPSDNAIVSDQAMQEIYLPAFAAAVHQGAAASVMCSYSTVNGTYACQNPYLLSTVLRQQFGFGGFVTSDWGATHSTAASANAGLTMDMPGSDGFYGSALQSAVSSGAVSQAALNSMVSAVLTEMFAFGLFDKPAAGSPAETATSAADQSDALQLDEEGAVLLKNSDGILPLSPSTKSIAVIGADASTSPLTAGGGSASVKSSGTVTPLQRITSRAGTGISVSYNDGSSDSSAAALAAASSIAIVFVRNFESEGSDLANIDLSSSQNSLISAVAAANPNTIVVLNTGSAVAMPWLSSVKGVLEAWYPGQEDGTAIAALLFGDADPSGHLPVTFPSSLSQVPASTPAQWTGTNGTVQYSEGVDVGYRWYDSQGLTPLFPFGYGLSYTRFSFSNLQVGTLPAGGAATISAAVTNTGATAGADVVQLYVTDPPASGQPPRQLEGFARVNLQPGASQTITFPITQRNLQYWNSSSNSFTTATGNYGIEVGDSSESLPLTGTLPVTSSQLGQPVSITNPGPQEGLAGTTASVPVIASDSTPDQTLSYSATGLPAGTSISPSSGTITGAPTTPGTSTVTLRAQDSAGAFATTSFTWTVEPGTDGIAATPLVGYQGLCLDIAGDSDTNGTKVDIYTCNGTDGQQWTLKPNNTVQADGKCLDAIGGGTANGTKVDLYDCNGTGAQVWIPQADGALLNPQSNACLDDTGFSTTPGTQVQIWSCSGNSNQPWISPASATGPVTGYVGLCLDVRGDNSANGTLLRVYTCNGTAAQQWTTEPNGSLRALGKCLDVIGGGTADGTQVDLYACNGTGAQVWQPRPGGALVNPQSGKCLDDTGFSTTPGTQAQIWSCTGNANQSWTLP
jgi:beta-glucosidase